MKKQPLTVADAKVRRPSIVGPEPTAGSIARYQERVRLAFMPPLTKDGESNEDYAQRYSLALVNAQKNVRQPSLPIIGHGTQLADIRLAQHMEAEQKRLKDVPDNSAVDQDRQMRRSSIKAKHHGRPAATNRPVKVPMRLTRAEESEFVKRGVRV